MINIHLQDLRSDLQKAIIRISYHVSHYGLNEYHNRIRDKKYNDLVQKADLIVVQIVFLEKKKKRELDTMSLITNS